MIPRMDITTAIGKEDIPCDRLGSKVLHCIKQPTTTTDKQLLQMLYCTSICYKYCILRATAANVVLCEHLLQILYFTSNCYKYCIVRATATNVVLYEHLLQMLYCTSICYKCCIVRAYATNIVFYEQLLQMLYCTSNCYKCCILRAFATNIVLYEQLLQMLYCTSKERDIFPPRGANLWFVITAMCLFGSSCTTSGNPILMDCTTHRINHVLYRVFSQRC